MGESDQVGLISGTGEEGQGIALRLAAAGNRVAVGSRSAERARQVALEINRTIGKENVRGMDNHVLIGTCETLFLTVPYIYSQQVISQYREELSPDQILVDVTVPVVFDPGPRLVDLGDQSGAEYLQSLLPSGPAVVAAFKTLPAHLLRDIDSPLDCDEFVCSDSSEAKSRVLEVVGTIPSLRWIDAGPLRYSRSLEAITLLEIGLNQRYRVKNSRVQIVGLETPEKGSNIRKEGADNTIPASKMIVALAGGVGGSKLVLGFSRVLPPDQLSIIGNTGDDIELLGLRICPDLDTITYTLSGLVNPLTGWGIREDSFACLEAVAKLGAPTWFKLGDQDLATHLWRTLQLEQGHSLTQATANICRSLGVEQSLLPMTDSYVPTYVLTDQGELHLQEYLVREGCRPTIRGFKHLNMEKAQPAPGVADTIMAAKAVILCPSNPFISINPILAVPGLRKLLSGTQAPVIAVTPIVEGGAIKGPAAKMLQELGYPVSPVSIAQMYQDFLDCFVLDARDARLLEEIEALNIKVLTADTLMDSLEDKITLADRLLETL